MLTKFKDHADTLLAMLQDKADHVFLLKGGRSRKENEQIRGRMKSVPANESMILDKMYYKRLRAYKKIGYEITPEYWDGNINWINSGEVNKLRICNASKKISQLGMGKSATKLLNRGTTVIAITGATLGQVSLLEIDTCANQSVIGIGENQIKKDFIYPLIMHHISDLIKKQTGGAQQHINMNDVKSLEIMVPTLTQYRDYSFEVMPLFDLQSSLCVKIEKMKELKALYLKKFFG